MKNISIHKNTFTRAALTLLVVLAITLTASATDFITDVMVAGHSDQTQFNTLIQNLQQEGWTDINYDLNKGCGSSSYYIHLLYKTQSSSGNTGVPITDFYVRTGANPPDNLTYGGRTYYLASCQGKDNFVSGYGDLNAGCGSSSDYIFLYYTKDALSNNTGVTAITFNTTQSGAVGSNGGSTGYDLNSGAGGAYIYMHLTTATGANVVTLSSGSGNVPLRNGHILTGTGGTETQVTIADGATVTLSSVNITAITNNSSHQWPGISCLGNATIVLGGNTTNNVKGGYRSSGIYVPQNKTLTLQGSGTLNATGSQKAAGIGSSYGNSCGNITINSGTVNATGGQHGAGIGSGCENSSCGSIFINGGTVAATGGEDAAGIGSGSDRSDCWHIRIYNTVTQVTATKGTNCNNAIGAGGGNSTCQSVTIGDVETGFITQSPFVTFPYTVAFDANGGTGSMSNQGFMYNVAQNLFGNIFSRTYYEFEGWATSADGPKVYNDEQEVNNLVQTPCDTLKLYAKWILIGSIPGELLLHDGDILTGIGGINTHVSIADGATVTFSGVDITGILEDDNHQWPGITCLGDAVIVLAKGTTNSVKGGGHNPGIYVPQNKTLTLRGSGIVNATGGFDAAGIGSGFDQPSCGDITISGGNVTATGAGNAAGIGCGRRSSCGNITISGGTVTAIGGGLAAGIGSRGESSCGDITISGGTVMATGGNYGAGIGSGYGIDSSSCGNITISGGTVTASGGSDAAGIGSGYWNSSCGTVTITNGVTMVTVTAGQNCNNTIGAGNHNSSCGTVTIGDVVTGFITQSPFTTFPYNVAFDANGGIATRTTTCNYLSRSRDTQISWTYGEAPSIDIDFEDGTMGNWTQIDADGDGNIWRLLSELSNSFGHNNSGDCIFSQSFDNNLGILTPDNYFVSPQTTLGGIFTFWACAQDASWPDEHFGVAISTTGNTSASDFTTVQEWTMAAKSYGQPTDATRSGNSNQGTWYQYTVDLSSYAGQTGYIAIRHFNCTDFFWLDVDDITYTFGSNVIAVGDQVFMYNVAQNLFPNLFSRPGFAFEGWATTADGPKVYDNEESVINLTETPGNTVTLYAKWHVPTPMGLTCTGVTPTSATLTWASEAASWQIMLNNDEQNLIDANAKPFTLTDLTPQTSYTVKVRGISDNTYSDWSDSQSFTTTEWQVVPAPTGLTCTSVTSTTATLTWSSEAASWQIMLNNDEQNLIDANVKPFILTGLAPNTTYTVKVRVLSSGTYSDWSDSQTFTTNKQGQQALPYAYSFENNNLSADGWRLQGASRNCTGIHNALAHTGSYLLRISFSENGVYLVSPIFTGGDNGIYMSFYYTEYDNMYGSEKFQVGYTTDETVTNPSNFTYGEVVTADTHWQQYSQIFPAGTKRIAIKYIHTRSWYLFLDDFLFKVPGEVSSFDLPIAAYTDNGGYHLIASPIADPITPNAENGFITTGTFDLYRFNQAADAEWENWKADGTDHYHFTLESGKGYLYANSGNVTITFVGAPYSGNGEVTLTENSNADLPGWNLVGNPFADTAYLQGNVAFYVMNDGGSEIVTANRNYVEPMEGIFVVANTDGETLTFTTAPQAPQKEGVILNLSDGLNVIDRAIVRFDDGPQLPKYQLDPSHTKVYISQDGKDYAVVNANGTDEIPVNFKANEDGEYTLTISESLNSKFLINSVEGCAVLNYLHLIDSLTGTDVDLLTSPSYTFTAKSTDYASRFKLVFSVK